MPVDLIFDEESSASHDGAKIRPTQPDDSLLLDEYSRTVVAAVERVAPSVVNIEIRQRRGSRAHAHEIGGSGSPFISTPDGFILTKIHYVPCAHEIPTNLPDVRHDPEVNH